MSASLRVRFGVVSAGLACLLLSFAVAHDNRVIDTGSGITSATGQTDRATVQQADPSAVRY